MTNSSKASAVAEFQGLYGPFYVNELLLQKIWSIGAFDTSRLVDDRGRKIEILSPGVWNRLDGPDFKDAIIQIDERKMFGDVEIHFSTGDWKAHGHGENPAFDKVILHVVYHPLNDIENSVEGLDERGIPALSLMEHLWHDLEEYMTDESLLASTREQREAEVEGLHDLDTADRQRILLDFARERWQLKKRFAKLRISKLGWEQACHFTGLEIMGYSQNRIPMLRVASRFGLKDFASGKISVDEMFACSKGKWRTSGVRPANGPKLRLHQYSSWIQAIPSWPDRLKALASALPSETEMGFDSLLYRRSFNLSALRYRLLASVVQNQIPGSKFDTLICDGFLPLLSAELDKDYFSLWFHWFAGNAPDRCVNSLKRLQIVKPRVAPLCNGWVQSVLRSRGYFDAPQVSRDTLDF